MKRLYQVLMWILLPCMALDIFIFGVRLAYIWRGSTWPYFTPLGDVTNPVGIVLLELPALLINVYWYLLLTRRIER